MYLEEACLREDLRLLDLATEGKFLGGLYNSGWRNRSGSGEDGSYFPPLRSKAIVEHTPKAIGNAPKGDKRKSKAAKADEEAGGFAPGVEEHVAREAKKASKPKTVRRAAE